MSTCSRSNSSSPQWSPNVSPRTNAPPPFLEPVEIVSGVKPPVAVATVFIVHVSFVNPCRNLACFGRSTPRCLWGVGGAGGGGHLRICSILCVTFKRQIGGQIPQVIPFISDLSRTCSPLRYPETLYWKNQEVPVEPLVRSRIHTGLQD